MVDAQLRIANRLAEIDKAGEWAERFCSSHGLPAEARTGLRISLDEALSNIISYAYDDGREHEIALRLTYAEGTLALMVEDDGVPFDPTQAPVAERGGSVMEREVGGLGIEFLKNLNDQVAYERVDGRNRLVLKKNVTETT